MHCSVYPGFSKGWKSHWWCSHNNSQNLMCQIWYIRYFKGGIFHLIFSFSFVCKFPDIPTVRSLLAWQSCLHGMSSFTFGVLYMTLHVQFTPFQLILLERFCCLSLFFVNSRIGVPLLALHSLTAVLHWDYKAKTKQRYPYLHRQHATRLAVFWVGVWLIFSWVEKNSALWLLLSLLLLLPLPTHTVYVTQLDATSSRLFSRGCRVEFWEIPEMIF